MPGIMFWSITKELSSEDVFLRPGADCHAMAAGLKAAKVLYFYWQTRREFVRNVRARLGQDISLILWVFFFFSLLRTQKRGSVCVCGFGLGVAQDTAFFAIVVACVFCFHLVPLDIACGLLAVLANSSVQQSRTENFVIQNTTDYRSFRLPIHTYTRFERHGKKLDKGKYSILNIRFLSCLSKLSYFSNYFCCSKISEFKVF